MSVTKIDYNIEETSLRITLAYDSRINGDVSQSYLTQQLQKWKTLGYEEVLITPTNLVVIAEVTGSGMSHIYLDYPPPRAVVNTIQEQALPPLDLWTPKFPFVSSITNASAIVTGQGFQSIVKVGETLRSVSTDPIITLNGTVQTINSDTQLTMSAVQGITLSGFYLQTYRTNVTSKTPIYKPYYIIYTAKSTEVFNPAIPITIKTFTLTETTKTSVTVRIDDMLMNQFRIGFAPFAYNLSSAFNSPDSITPAVNVKSCIGTFTITPLATLQQIKNPYI